MKIALNIFLVLALALTNPLVAQQKQCDDNLAEIKKLVTDSELDQAYAKYIALDKKCISTEDIFYHNMEHVLITKTKGAVNDLEKQAFLDQLLELYTTHDYILPKNKSSNKVRKAMALSVNRPEKQDEIYKLLDEAFAKDRENFVNPEALYIYYDMLFKKATADKNTTDYSALINKRDEVLAQMQFAKASSKNERPFNIAARAIKKLTATVLDCDKTVAHYNSIFDDRKLNKTWLSNTAAALEDNNCTADSLFIKVAQTWYDLEVTEQSTSNLAMAQMRNNNQKESIKLYEAAANLATTAEAKGSYYYIVARQLMAVDKLRVIEFTNKAITADPTMGKAYLIMADAYAGMKDCGKSAFENKLVYYLAAEAAAKAGVAQPSLKKIADKKVEQYLKSAPTSSEIKQSKMGGKTIALGCGLKQKVSIPKK